MIPREQLLVYKRRLDRPVDRADVGELTAEHLGYEHASHRFAKDLPTESR